MREYKGKKNIEQEISSVICYLRELLEQGDVNPGERLPAERKISEDTGVSRAKVRLALERLESYGVLKILPQSGSVLSQHSRTALITQISSIVDSSSFDFNSLVQVRTLLECESVRQCARNYADADAELLRAAFDDFVANVQTALRDEKDFAFHVTIAKCCHNPVIYQLLLMITPDVLGYYRRLKACAVPAESVVAEHKEILDFILARKGDEAAAALQRHFRDITEFAANNPGMVPRTRL